MSPEGPGNALFIVSDLTENMPRIYSDNIAMARWFQREIVYRQYEPFGDLTLDVIEAEFDKNGDVRSFWTERVLTDDEEITLTWYDIQEPSMINPQPNSRARAAPRRLRLHDCVGGRASRPQRSASPRQDFPGQRAPGNAGNVFPGFLRNVASGAIAGSFPNLGQ